MPDDHLGASMPDDLNETVIEFPDNRLLIDLCGQFDRNLAQLEQGFGVAITRMRAASVSRARARALCT